MSKNFQQVIMTLHEYWASQGCVLWQPHNVQVGAGTSNPATLLRVLGPEPWRVAYVEPSVRPDDGRYGENPNRMQYYYQYQVILKPDPGNPQELYLQSLEALGLSQREHDIRFVEDNWENPSLGAWGLGWEVWLDGQEITQFTYFQQAGGTNLDVVSVEITYGIERIVLALQGKDAAWDIQWMENDADADGDGHKDLLYSDILLRPEYEHSKYYFEVADVDGLKQTYDFYEAEFQRALDAGVVAPAYDYVLKCSHLFNVLDTRGAIGVTDRAAFFKRMRNMTLKVAEAFVNQREELGYPLKKLEGYWQGEVTSVALPKPPEPTEAADLLFEIGVEELPADDVDIALEQLEAAMETFFVELRLMHEGLNCFATPRRLVIAAENVSARQADDERVEKGPPADRAFDADGNPTKAGQGFARGKGVDVADLKIEEIDGGRYVTALVKDIGRPAPEVLAEALPNLIASLKFKKTMRWNATGTAFSRPIRWLVALFGEAVIPFEYAGIVSGNVTKGLRPYSSPEFEVKDLDAFYDILHNQHIILDDNERRDEVWAQATELAETVGGKVAEDPDLLDEVTNLVEAPTALLGSFSDDYLALPREVLVTVMRKHQRYFAVEDAKGDLMPFFIAVRNGDSDHLDKVQHGNEHVLRARYADAQFFYNEDRRKPLEDFLPRLGTLTFHEKIGSMAEKNERVAGLVQPLGELLGINATEMGIAQRAAHIAKADLATQMVVEMTSLQGIMGREYAKLEGYPEDVAKAIFEHWLPRSADDMLPSAQAGLLLGLADRLDTLAGLFGAGLAPRSSADPYGLRRAALGVVQLLVHGTLEADFVQLIDQVADAQPIDVDTATRDQLVEFMGGRLEVWLQDQNYPTDVVKAVVAEQGTNPQGAVTGADELSKWVTRDDWEPILDGFARCVRITRSEETRYSVDPAHFGHDEERALYEAYTSAADKLDGGNVDAFLTAFEPMLPAVTAFFDAVLVNAEDETVRHNRLGLLQHIGGMAKGRADLSELSGF